MSVRKRLKQHEIDMLGLEHNENNRYRLSPEQWQQVLNCRNSKGILEGSSNLKIDVESVKNGWLKTDSASFFFTNPFYNPNDQLPDVEFITEIVQKYVQPVKVQSVERRVQSAEWIDRLIISDVHINMNNLGDSNTSPIFATKLYDKEEILNRLETTINTVLRSKKGADLIIDNLGDFMDGQQGQTTRGGHSLPQIMSDKEAFEVAISFKMQLIEGLIGDYKTITLNNIINDNHSFLMAYYVHSAVKKIIEAKYPGRVFYNIHEKFISHYSVGNHTFIITHGKDSKEMRFGWKLHLDGNLIKKIDGYCKHFSIYNGNRVEVSKGDLHQYTADLTSSNDFEYVNYPSFAPPSNWVQTNFGHSKSGFVIQHLSEEDKITNIKFF